MSFLKIVEDAIDKAIAESEAYIEKNRGMEEFRSSIETVESDIKLMEGLKTIVGEN